MQRVAVIAKLKPDAETRAEEPHQGRSAFDPQGTDSSGTPCSSPGSRPCSCSKVGGSTSFCIAVIRAPKSSKKFRAWEPLLEGLPKVAHEAYFWQRAMSGPRTGASDRLRRRGASLTPSSSVVPEQGIGAFPDGATRRSSHPCREATNRHAEEACDEGKDIMTRDVATVGQRASLKQVARVMTDRGVSGVPVVNAENHVLCRHRRRHPGQGSKPP